MPFVDTTSIIGGLGQSIVDWGLGDDRRFSGDITSLMVVGDSGSKAYFTLKSAPNLPDAQAIIQKVVTTVAGSSGSIITLAGDTVLNVNVFSADYEGLVFIGPVYYWDFRVITAAGYTFTVATGQVQFVQNVTQTNVVGTPGPIPMGPNNGQPRFRGFSTLDPMLLPNVQGTFVKGDYFRNSNPAPGGPSGWVCIVTGSLPGGGAQFVTDGIVGNSP